MFLMPDNKWARLLAYVTGLVNQKLLLQNEYLAAENRILRAHLPARMRLSDPERSTLAEIGKQLGRTARATNPLPASAGLCLAPWAVADAPDLVRWQESSTRSGPLYI